MRHSMVHQLVCWTCLLAFVVSGTLGRRLVLCTDGSGSPRIEWGCESGSDGSCATDDNQTAATEPGASASPVPCEDMPVEVGPIHAGAGEAPRALAGVSLLALVGVPGSRIGPERGMNRRPPIEGRVNRPPGDASRLRSVVLVV